jgi:glycerophosphoryl diester phosphodiesterase
MRSTACRIAFCLALWGVITVALGDAASLAADKQPSSAARNRVSSGDVLVIAHRGDSAVAPENTLPAFDSAVKAGADLVELDYCHSFDGVPVVCHDKELDRTTNACQLWRHTQIKVADKTLVELQRLDAGSWFDAKFAGTTLPTLAQALDAIQAGSITLIERKGGDPATCVRLLTQKRLLDQVVVQAFDWDFLAVCHHLAPDLVLGALGDKELTPARLNAVADTGASVVGWNNKYLDAAGIATIHARGWKAWVWTVDDLERGQELVRAGIDGVITNRPAEMRKAVAAALAARPIRP